MKRLFALTLLTGLALAQVTGSGAVMLGGSVMTGGSGPSGHYVALSWAQSTSPNITRNTVYRSTTSGAETLYYSCTAPCTTYSDHQVSGGVTYYYEVTATDNTGAESGKSNEFKAVIP